MTDREQTRYRSNVMLVNNDQWNARFFKACQSTKDSRFRDQKVAIVAWKAYRRGGLVGYCEETDINITEAAMTGAEPPSFSDYIEFINEHDKAGLNDDGELTLSLTMAITYQPRKKAAVK